MLVRSGGDVQLGDYEGGSLHVLAGGSVTVGDIEITRPGLVGNTVRESVVLSDGVTVVDIDGEAEPTVDVRAGKLDLVREASIGQTVLSRKISMKNIINHSSTVLLENQQRLHREAADFGNIKVENDIDTSGYWKGGDVFIDSSQNILIPGDIITSSFSDLQDPAARVNNQEDYSSVEGGELTLLAKENAILGSLVSNARLSRFDTNSITEESNGKIIVKGGDISIIAQKTQVEFIWTSAGNIKPGLSFESGVNLAYSDIELLSGNVAVIAEEFELSDSLYGGEFYLGLPGMTNRLVTSSQFFYEGQGHQEVQRLLLIGGNVSITAEKNILFDDIVAGPRMDVDTSALVAGNDDFAAAISALTTAKSGDISLYQENGNLNLKSLNFDLRVVDNDEIYGRLINGDSRTIDSGSGGEFLAYADEIILNQVNISTNALGDDGTVGNVKLEATGLVKFSDSEISAISEADSQSQGGKILLTGKQVLLEEATLIDASTFGNKDGGTVEIIAQDLIELNDSNVISSTIGSGHAGDIVLISAGEIRLIGNSAIATSALLGSDGNGGSISLEAKDRIAIDGSNATWTHPLQPGEGTSVVNRSNLPREGENYLIDGYFVLDSNNSENPLIGFSSQIPYVSILKTEADSRADIDAGCGPCLDFYQFEVSSAGVRGYWNGEPGGIGNAVYLLDSQDDFLYANPEPLSFIPINSGRFVFREPGMYKLQFLQTITNRGYTLNIQLSDGIPIPAGLSAQTEGAGDAGNITVKTPQLSILNGGQIATSTTSTGKAGNITFNSLDSDILSINIQDNSRNLPNLARPTSQITAETQGAGNGGDIILSAPEAINIIGNGALNAQTSDTGSAGNVIVLTDLLTIDQGTRLTTTATETATPPANTQDRTASIELNANTMNLFGTVEVLSETQGDAQAGTLTLRPNSGDNLTINLADQSRVSASTSSDGLGGSLFLTAQNAITVSGDGTLSAEAANGKGRAGQVQVQAQQFTLQDGAKLSTLTTGEGQGGEIEIDADRVTVLDSTITAETEGLGNAGSILITPQADGRSLTIDLGDNSNSQITARTTNQGNGGNITLSAPDSITITGNGTLNAETSATGSAGKVDVTTNLLTIDQGTSLTTTAKKDARPPANTEAPVPGGSISLQADQMNLFGKITVLSQTEGAAPAGTITLTPNDSSDLDINLRDNSIVSTASSGSGRGGSLTVSAPRNLTISGQGRLTAETSGTGAAGDVSIRAQQFTLQDGAEISTRTTGAGEGGQLQLDIGSGTTQLSNAKLIADSTQPDDTLAGNLSLQTGQLNLNNSLIDVRNAGNDDGGNIDIRSNRAAILTNQSSIQTNATGNGNGGNIFIRTPFLSAPVGENSDIIANAIAGSGGNISIKADAVVNFELRDEPEPALRSNSSNDISASSELGIDGTLSLDGFNVDPSQGAAELPITLPDPSDQISNQCSASRLARSEFVMTGRNGIPQSPSEPLELAGPRPSRWLDLPDEQVAKANPSFTNTDQTPSRTIAEASQWQVNKDGQVKLVATGTSEPNALPTTVCAAEVIQSRL